jgi:hypothetical protein
MTVWYVLLPIGKFNGHLLHFVVIWYIFSRFGIFYQEKSGNPALGVVGACRNYISCQIETFPAFVAVASHWSILPPTNFLVKLNTLAKRRRKRFGTKFL